MTIETPSPTPFRTQWESVNLALLYTGYGNASKSNFKTCAVDMDGRAADSPNSEKARDEALKELLDKREIIIPPPDIKRTLNHQVPY